MHDHDLLAGAVRTDTRGVNPATPRSPSLHPLGRGRIAAGAGARSDARRLTSRNCRAPCRRRRSATIRHSTTAGSRRSCRWRRRPCSCTSIRCRRAGRGSSASAPTSPPCSTAPTRGCCRRRPLQRPRPEGGARVRAPPRRARRRAARPARRSCACTSRSRGRPPVWKGLINDPHLDDSGDVNTGLGSPASCSSTSSTSACRSAASSSTRSPRSTSPTPSPGARSARARPRARCTASSPRACRCPSASRTAPTATSASRSTGCGRGAQPLFPGIDLDGRSAILRTSGNPDCHVILRGGRERDQLRRRLRRRDPRRPARRRAARAGDRRRLPRQQQQGPRAPARRRRRDRRADGRRRRRRSSA